MKEIIGIATVALLSSLFVTGCANTQPPTTSGIGTNEMTQGDKFSKHLKLDKPELALKLNIAEVKSRKTNRLLEVNLQLASTFKKSLKLQYHFNWFDEQGFVVEARKTPWKPVELHGFQSTTLRGVAPNEQVASFNVYVRETAEKSYKY